MLRYFFLKGVDSVQSAIIWKSVCTAKIFLIRDKNTVFSGIWQEYDQKGDDSDGSFIILKSGGGGGGWALTDWLTDCLSDK